MSDPIIRDDILVTARDVVDAGFCIMPGLKEFLEIRGYDLKEFVRNGLPAETFRKFNDARSDRVVVKAMERAGRG